MEDYDKTPRSFFGKDKRLRITPAFAFLDCCLLKINTKTDKMDKAKDVLKKLRTKLDKFPILQEAEVGHFSISSLSPPRQL